MSRTLKAILIMLGIEGAVALTVAGALVFGGFYNVAATAQHSRPTAWLLHTTMRHSVARGAERVEDPPPFNDTMVVRGAAHFRAGCAPCHGAPGEAPSAIERNAEPPPPLYAAFATWSPQELFWLVKHGVKLTAMPAWPAQTRDDEVWDMVAFLRAMPTMAPRTFAQLATGSKQSETPDDPAPTLANLAATRPDALARCLPCHGGDGDGRANAFPKLAGLSSDYIERALRDFRSGGRPSGYMQRAASDLTDNDIRELARYFAFRPSASPDHAGTASETVSLGERVAHYGTTSGHVPACESCHGSDRREGTPGLPSLAGQPASYLKTQLSLFAAGIRTGTAEARIMANIAAAMSAAERDAVANYFASLGGRTD